MSSVPPDNGCAADDEDPDLVSVFGVASPADTCMAVLTEARIVLPDLDTALDAELWGSDILAALDGCDGVAEAIVAAAEQAATPEAVALLRVLGAIGPADVRARSAAAADRLAEAGQADPAWASAVGSPTVGECWRYRDTDGGQEAVTMAFRYGLRQHVVSVLIDHSEGGAIQDVWIGGSSDVLKRTRQLSDEDPQMIFEMITPEEARDRLNRAFAAGECPHQAEEISNVASRRAILRARIALLPSKPRGWRR